MPYSFSPLYLAKEISIFSALIIVLLKKMHVTHIDMGNALGMRNWRLKFHIKTFDGIFIGLMLID